MTLLYGAVLNPVQYRTGIILILYHTHQWFYVNYQIIKSGYHNMGEGDDGYEQKHSYCCARYQVVVLYVWYDLELRYGSPPSQAWAVLIVFRWVWSYG